MSIFTTTTHGDFTVVSQRIEEPNPYVFAMAEAHAVVKAVTETDFRSGRRCMVARLGGLVDTIAVDDEGRVHGQSSAQAFGPGATCLDLPLASVGDLEHIEQLLALRSAQLLATPLLTPLRLVVYVEPLATYSEDELTRIAHASGAPLVTREIRHRKDLL